MAAIFIRTLLPRQTHKPTNPANMLMNTTMLTFFKIVLIFRNRQPLATSSPMKMPVVICLQPGYHRDITGIWPGYDYGILLFTPCFLPSILLPAPCLLPAVTFDTLGRRQTEGTKYRVFRKTVREMPGGHCCFDIKAEATFSMVCIVLIIFQLIFLQ